MAPGGSLRDKTRGPRRCADRASLDGRRGQRPRRLGAGWQRQLAQRAPVKTNLDPADADSLSDVFVRDLQANTTTLVTRAGGAAGAKANNLSILNSISADGRHVAYHSHATNLSPDDTTSGADAYARDLQTDTTLLVSRASGATGAKGNNDSMYPSMSGDGRFVGFMSRAGNLDPDDTDGTFDIFVRDLVTGTTKLVSRGTGASGPKGNFDSIDVKLSHDGRFAAFSSAATVLSPDDFSGDEDVYVRDLEQNTTALVSRTTGTPGIKGNGNTFLRYLSPSGRFVLFDSTAANLGGDVATPAVDLRDLQTGVTTIANRASGADGAVGNQHSVGSFATEGGRYVVFSSRATNLEPGNVDGLYDVYVRDVATDTTHMESRASPSYPRPRGATPLRASLVTAHEQCTGPNRTHGAPLAFDACSPPTAASDQLTIGTPDANGMPPASVGSVTYSVTPGDDSTAADEADLRVTASITDVRVVGTLDDYMGELGGVASVRVTDSSNGPFGGEPGTTEDFTFSFTLPCTATGNTAAGATCSVLMTADTLVPGAIKEGKRAIWELGAVRVTDAGPDGEVSSDGDNRLFAVEGIFVP